MLDGSDTSPVENRHNAGKEQTYYKYAYGLTSYGFKHMFLRMTKSRVSIWNCEKFLIHPDREISSYDPGIRETF